MQCSNLGSMYTSALFLYYLKLQPPLMNSSFLKYFSRISSVADGHTAVWSSEEAHPSLNSQEQDKHRMWYQRSDAWWVVAIVPVVHYDITGIWTVFMLHKHPSRKQKSSPEQKLRSVACFAFWKKKKFILCTILLFKIAFRLFT